VGDDQVAEIGEQRAAPKPAGGGRERTFGESLTRRHSLLFLGPQGVVAVVLWPIAPGGEPIKSTSPTLRSRGGCIDQRGRPSARRVHPEIRRWIGEGLCPPSKPHPTPRGGSPSPTKSRPDLCRACPLATSSSTRAAPQLGVARQTVLNQVRSGHRHAVHVVEGKRRGLRIRIHADEQGQLTYERQEEQASSPQTSDGYEAEAVVRSVATACPYLRRELMGAAHQMDRATPGVWPPPGCAQCRAHGGPTDSRDRTGRLTPGVRPGRVWPIRLPT